MYQDDRKMKKTRSKVCKRLLDLDHNTDIKNTIFLSFYLFGVYDEFNM
jgi:hypothetical protein